MKNRDIEQALQRSIDAIIPDVFDSINASETDKMSESEYIFLTSQTIKPIEQKSIKETTTRHTLKSILKLWRPYYALVMFALVISLSVFSYQNPATLIAIDINPSIEITTNRYERIIKISALNQDARIVLSELNLKGEKLPVAIKSVTQSIIKYGYLNKPNSSILVSVLGKNENTTQKVENNLVADINQTLKRDKIDATVYIQTLTIENEDEDEDENNKKITKLKVNEDLNKENKNPANKNLSSNKGSTVDHKKNIDEEVSFGKSALIQKLINKYPSLDQKTLTKASIKDITEMLDDKNDNLQTLLNSDNKSSENKDSRNNEQPMNNNGNDKQKSNKNINKPNQKDNDAINNKQSTDKTNKKIKDKEKDEEIYKKNKLDKIKEQVNQADKNKDKDKDKGNKVEKNKSKAKRNNGKKQNKQK